MNNPTLYNSKVKIIVHVAWTVDHFSNWLASNLSIFYLLKIAISQPNFFFTRSGELKCSSHDDVGDIINLVYSSCSGKHR